MKGIWKLKNDVTNGKNEEKLPVLVKMQELCFVPEEKTDAKIKKSKYRSVPLKHRYINLLYDFGNKELILNSEDIMINIAKLCPTKEAKIIYKLITKDDGTKKRCCEHTSIYNRIFENRINIDAERIILLKGKSVMCKYGKTDCALAEIGDINKDFALKKVKIK